MLFSGGKDILLTNGRLFDPASGLDQKGDILLSGGKIKKIGGYIEAPDARSINCDSLLVTPGLIDIHVHLREPGQEYKEDIASGTKAAAAGGFTAVACMPNTNPVNDCKAVTDLIIERARDAGSARVYPIAAITPGLGGAALTEMAELKEAGCVAVSDDGRPVPDSRLLRRAMEYARGLGLPVVCHSEDLRLSAGGAMHEGPTATRLGIPGIPAEAEVTAIERDISLAGLSGARVHIAHVSCAGSVEAVRRAKDAGYSVTAETCPHYLVLCDEDIGEYDTHRKMNPPLRSRADMEAVRLGLAEGIIDTLATDHAPHSSIEKNVEFDKALFGVTGLETALAIGLELVSRGVLSLERLISAMTTAPAAALNLPGGMLQEGALADIAVINATGAWTVEPEKMYSKSVNTPFAGRSMTGRAVLTICAGNITYHLEGFAV